MLEFVCKRCGRCCGLTPWEKSEYKAVMRTAHRLHVAFVKQTIKGHVVYFVRSIVKKGKKLGVENMNPEDMICPFMGTDGNGKTFCKVYEYRPMMCRKFGVDGEESELLRCPQQNKPEEN